ncbi:hypothetical protein CSOJ01_06758 [Colletotrichum sojae]|uniref:Uncharacterized protein n=1 Tax=Colletotrichum sojae TaxID=2175907 RepID=A0A8H6MVD0_9PEZI|nr:hypothetical protein CSOJ01_06758 [Colletotrichum sojae]
MSSTCSPSSTSSNKKKALRGPSSGVLGPAPGGPARPASTQRQLQQAQEGEGQAGTAGFRGEWSSGRAGRAQEDSVCLPTGFRCRPVTPANVVMGRTWAWEIRNDRLNGRARGKVPWRFWHPAAYGVVGRTGEWLRASWGGRRNAALDGCAWCVVLLVLLVLDCWCMRLAGRLHVCVARSGKRGGRRRASQGVLREREREREDRSSVRWCVAREVFSERDKRRVCRDCEQSALSTQHPALSDQQHRTDRDPPGAWSRRVRLSRTP